MNCCLSVISKFNIPNEIFPFQSGTVGNPKGVMLSHDNLTWDALCIVERLGIIAGDGEVLVSYLPLSHVAAQVVDIYITMSTASTIYFADKDALKGNITSLAFLLLTFELCIFFRYFDQYFA